MQTVNIRHRNFADSVLATLIQRKLAGEIALRRMAIGAATPEDEAAVARYLALAERAAEFFTDRGVAQWHC